MILATDAASLAAATTGAIAAVAGIVAAIYAVRTFTRMGTAERRAEERHTASILPRPTFNRAELHGQPSGGKAALELRPINAGGAATNWVAVLHVGTFLFIRKGPCPAHYVMAPGSYELLHSVGQGLPDAYEAEVLGSHALDVEGQAWDALRGIRTEQSPSEYFRERLAPWGIAVSDDCVLSPLPSPTSPPPETSD